MTEIQIPERPVAAAGGSGLRISNPGGPRELIMLVDDDEFFSLLTERVLVSDGYKVVVARNGVQAVDFFQVLHDEVELVLLDYVMPIMDGTEVFEELRGIDPRVGVLMTSGYTDPDRFKGLIEKGARGFIPKPMTQTTLLTQVRATLDRLAISHRK